MPQNVEIKAVARDLAGLEAIAATLADSGAGELLQQHDIFFPSARGRLKMRMVNGAGLAMATMDIIKLNGGEPANFCDLGGGVNEKQVADAFEIVNSDSNVKALLINIFGGIVRCDTVATGIVNAYKNVGLSIPLIVRLEGTNSDIAKAIIDEAAIPGLVSAVDLDDAAAKAVAAI